MPDVILELGAELDGGSINKIKADLAAALASTTFSIKASVDSKGIAELRRQIQDLSTNPVLIKVNLDKASLAAAAQEIQKTLAAAMGSTTGSGGAAGGPGVASANKMQDTIIAGIRAGAVAAAAAAKQATAQITVEGEKQLQAQKTIDGQLLRDQQDALMAKRQSQKQADSMALADKQAALKKQVDAEAAANKIMVDNAKTANDLILKDKEKAGQLAVATVNANAKIQSTETKTQSAEAIEASRSADRQAALAVKQQAQDQQTAILKLYQQAAVYYQAANIMGKLGIPGAGAVTTIGSSLQTFGPALGTGAATGIGIGLAGLTVGTDVIKDSLKTFGTYETVLAKISNLTGTSAEELQTFKGQIAALSKETGRSQVDLAEGLYYIASSGFKGADAFQVLNASVKSSVAGMGDVQTIADVVTSMMNAYEISAADSFRVTDKLISAVREGKAEPAQFARSLGSVLPVARQAGLSLEETLGALSAMTLQTGNASQATTSLKQAIQSLLAPTSEARKELDLIYGRGKGVETVRVNLQTEGLQATLADIFKKTGGNIPSLDAIFGNIRGLVGVLQLANGNFEKFGEITGRIIKDVGLTVEGANNSAKTYENTLARMDTATENFKIKLGGLAAPIVIPIVVALTSRADTATKQLLMLFGQASPEDMASVRQAGIKQIEETGWLSNLLNSFMPGAAALSGQTFNPLALPIIKAQEEAYQKSLGRASRVSSAMNDPLRSSGKTPADRFAASSQLWALGMSPMELETARYKAGFGGIGPSWASLEATVPQPPMGPFPRTDIRGRTFGGIQRDAGVDTLALSKNYTDALEATVDARKEAGRAMEAVNKQIAADLTKSIDALISQGEKYDDFYTKYNDILAKIDATPDSVTALVRGGKAVTTKTLASEQAKIADLELRVKIDEINNRIRTAGLGKSKSGDVNAVRDLRDQASDLAAANRAKQLADLKGAGGGQAVTYENPEMKKLREEQEKALEAYNRGTFETFKSTFNDALQSSIKDTNTFNALLKDGGELLGAFAQSAGLLKSTGFVTTLGEAALQMKFLRDQATGDWLKGDALVSGLGKYGEALQNFKSDMLSFNKFITGEAAITKGEAVQGGLIKTIAQTGFLTPTSGGSGRASTEEEQWKALNEPGGVGAAVLKKWGLTGAGGAANPITGAINLKVGMVIGDASEDVKAARDKLQEAADAAGAAVKFRAQIVALGLSPDAAVANVGRDNLAEDVKSVLGNPEDWLNNAGKITLPNVTLTADSIDTATVTTQIENKVGEVKPVPKVALTVDVSSPTVIGQDALIAAIDAEVASRLSGRVYEYLKNNLKNVVPSIPGFASGSDFVPSSGFAKVGEDGPEIVWLPRGARVANATETSQMGSLDFRVAREAQRNFFGGVSGSSHTSITNVSVDARGAAEPKRTREQAANGVSMALLGRYAARRARETGAK